MHTPLKVNTYRFNFLKTCFFKIKNNKLILIQKLLKILENSKGTRGLTLAPTLIMLTLCFGRNEKTLHLHIQYNVYKPEKKIGSKH